MASATHWLAKSKTTGTTNSAGDLLNKHWERWGQRRQTRQREIGDEETQEGQGEGHRAKIRARKRERARAFTGKPEV